MGKYVTTETTNTMTAKKTRDRLHRILNRHRPTIKNHLPRLINLFRRNTLAAHSTGNQVILFETGNSLLKAMLEAISQARSEILAEFYIIRDDDAGQRFAAALSAAAARGVRVSLMYDYVGSFTTASSFFEGIAKNGVQCLSFNPPSFHRGLAWFDKRDHRKILVVDSQTAFTGSMNIGLEYVQTGPDETTWRDAGVRIDGPAAHDLARLFRELWTQEGGAPLKNMLVPHPNPPSDNNADVLVVSGGPHFSRSHIRIAFRLAFADADQSILIMTPYFMPGPRFLRSLIRAAHRGVRVVLVLPAICDVPLVQLASRGLHGPLLAAGVELYERQGAMLHSKVISVDNNWGMVGSANLDLRSFHRNFEMNLVVHGKDFGQRLASLIENELKGCRRVGLADHEGRGWPTRLIEKILQPIAWFL